MVLMLVFDTSYSKSHSVVEFTRPIPTNLAGRASSDLSTSKQSDRPVGAGINL